MLDNMVAQNFHLHYKKIQFICAAVDVRKLFMTKSNVTSTADLIAQGRVKWGDWFGGDAAYSTASSEICACQYLRGPNSCE